MVTGFLMFFDGNFDDWLEQIDDLGTVVGSV